MNDPLGHINAAGGPGGIRPNVGPGQGPGKTPLTGPNGKIFLDELKGQIAEEGTAEELRLRGALFARLWALQRNGLIGDELADTPAA